jgi:hypothetical protein
VVTRPTITTSVCTVHGAGVVLVENGWSNTVTTGPSGGNTASYPQSLLRLGTSNPHLDLELGLPDWMRTSVGGPIVSGVSDVAFGAKYELGYNALGDWGFNAVVSVPSGDTAFSAGESQYTLNGNMTYTFNSFLSFNATLGFNAFAGPDATGVIRRYDAVAPSAYLEFSPPGPTYMYFEGAYISKAGFGLPGKTSFDGGVVHDFGPHIQVDLSAGWSPSIINGQRQHYIAAGLSYMN